MVGDSVSSNESRLWLVIRAIFDANRVHGGRFAGNTSLATFIVGGSMDITIDGRISSCYVCVTLTHVVCLDSNRMGQFSHKIFFVRNVLYCGV